MVDESRRSEFSLMPIFLMVLPSVSSFETWISNIMLPTGGAKLG
jgi:hypothetical protein